MLKVLKKAGLTKDDVKLIELPSTGDVYTNALAAKQVDVAPIGGVSIKRYLTKYGKDGATTIQHGIRDDAGHLYVQTESLENAGKAAAIRAYVAAWGVAQEWIDKHPKEWIAGYYVKDQGLTDADGQWLVDNAGQPGHQRRLERGDHPAAGDDRPARQGDRQQGDQGRRPVRPALPVRSRPTRSRRPPNERLSRDADRRTGLARKLSPRAGTTAPPARPG